MHACWWLRRPDINDSSMRAVSVAVGEWGLVVVGWNDGVVSLHQEIPTPSTTPRSGNGADSEMAKSEAVMAKKRSSCCRLLSLSPWGWNGGDLGAAHQLAIFRGALAVAYERRRLAVWSLDQAVRLFTTLAEVHPP